MGVLKQIAPGAVSSAVDTVYNLGSGLLMNKMQYEQQKELMDKSYEQQLDFWKQQSAYNDPASQMMRLKKAGLNPALINANGVNNVAGGLSSVGAPSAPPVQPGHANVAQSAQALQSILKMAEETGFIDTQNQVMAQELINKIIKNEIDTIVKKLNLTESEIKELEKLSAELDFEEKYQFAFNRPSKEGGEMLVNNRLINERDRLQSEANYRDSIAALNTAYAETENLMREPRQAVAQAQKAYYDAQANQAYASASKLLAEGKAVTMENERRAYIQAVGDFFGINLFSLPPALQNFILNEYHKEEKYWQGIGKDENSYQTYSIVQGKIRTELQKYINNESKILTTESTGYNLSFFGVGVGNNSSTTKNSNK